VDQITQQIHFAFPANQWLSRGRRGPADLGGGRKLGPLVSRRPALPQRK
jgi:hypothetical protein